MKVDEPTHPEPGPPQKGFWGWLASFFPKQPKLERKDEATPGEQFDEKPAQQQADDPATKAQASDQLENPGPVGQPADESDTPAQGQEGRQTVGPFSQPGEVSAPTSLPNPPSSMQQSADEFEKAAQPGKPNEPLEGAPDVNDAQVPETEEESGGHDDEEEETPPTVVVPANVKAPGLEENEMNPPTLPTEPEASAGSQDDDSIPDEKKRAS